MPRLIDADDIWYDLLVNTGNKEHPLEWGVSQSRIDRMPTIDAVEVVRCRECKWYKTNYSWNGKEHKVCVIEPYEPIRKEEDYCSYGERREQ